MKKVDKTFFFCKSDHDAMKQFIVHEMLNTTSRYIYLYIWGAIRLPIAHTLNTNRKVGIIIAYFFVFEKSF